MRSIQVTTWNVLHRVHAVNWKEAPVATYPEERKRIQGISSLVAGWLANDVDVVVLQEVSGDQLASLRASLRGAATVFEHTYARVPRLRVEGWPAELADPTEHLVTIAKAPNASRLDARTFETDPGKGLLAIRIGPLAVVNTHVSARERRDAQLSTLAAVVETFSGGCVVGGDFNAPAAIVSAGLGAGGLASISISNLEGQRPTRIATEAQASRTIDHVVAVRGAIDAATVLDQAGLSDHAPVNAIASFPRLSSG